MKTENTNKENQNQTSETTQRRTLIVLVLIGELGGHHFLTGNWARGLLMLNNNPNSIDAR